MHTADRDVGGRGQSDKNWWRRQSVKEEILEEKKEKAHELIIYQEH